ncbi:MAG: hypothetical protein ABF743_02290 [Schleiferilactobacillus perolens]|uniref:hypothetical protein n=1 Tax=Schleiferilactobacillus perolens TaxID=100468 RepID=UPI0039EBA8EA
MSVSLLLNTIITVISVLVFSDYIQERRVLVRLHRAIVKTCTNTQQVRTALARTRYHQAFDHRINAADLSATVALALLVAALLNLNSFTISVLAILGMIACSLVTISLAAHNDDLASRSWKPRLIKYEIRTRQ